MKASLDRTDAEVEVADSGVIYAVALGFFVTIVVLTNTVGVKLFDFGGLSLPVSILWFPVTFLITDVVSEVYGARNAQRLVWVGFAVSVGLLTAVLVGINLPAAEAYVLDDAYRSVFSPTWRLLFASMTAYLLAQSIDVRLFHRFRRLTGGRMLWLRNNASTMLSQLVDTFTVTFIFLWNNPAVFNGTTVDLFGLSLRIYLAKVLIAALDTPLCYAAVTGIRWWLSRRPSDGTLSNSQEAA